MLEISKLVPEIFRHFEVDMVDPSRYRGQAGWLVVQSGLDIRSKSRDPNTLLVLE